MYNYKIEKMIQKQTTQNEKKLIVDYGDGIKYDPSQRLSYLGPLK